MRAAQARAVPAIVADPRTFGVLVFVTSESFFFGAIVVNYVAHREGGLALAREHLELLPTLIFSLLLFSSSATMARAAGSRSARAWLVATLALGAGFLGGQATEYARLLLDGVTPASGSWASAFFTLTGLHGLHVSAGLVAIAALALTMTVRPGTVRPVAIEAVGIYWHFVDAVWVVILSLVYVSTFL